MIRVFTRLLSIGLALLCLIAAPGVVAAQPIDLYQAFQEGPAEAWQTMLSILAATELNIWLAAGGVALLVLIVSALLIRGLARRRKTSSTSVNGTEPSGGRRPSDTETDSTTRDATVVEPEVAARLAAYDVPAGEAGALHSPAPASVEPLLASVPPEDGEAPSQGETTGPTEEDRPQTAGALVAMGQEAARKGDREAAHELVRQALETDPKNVDAWIWLAATTESPRESVICLKTALLLDPDNPKAKRGLAYYQPMLDESGGGQ